MLPQWPAFCSICPRKFFQMFSFEIATVKFSRGWCLNLIINPVLAGKSCCLKNKMVGHDQDWFYLLLTFWHFSSQYQIKLAETDFACKITSGTVKSHTMVWTHQIPTCMIVQCTCQPQNEQKTSYAYIIFFQQDILALLQWSVTFTPTSQQTIWSNLNFQNQICSCWISFTLLP